MKFSKQGFISHITTLFVLIFLGNIHLVAEEKVFDLKKLYGKLEYTFLKEDNDNSQSYSTSHLQAYQVGYRSFYYSPKFLQYDLSGTLYINKTTATIADRNNDQDIESFDYKANLDFIQGSKYPFTVFAEKSNIPFINLLSGNTLYSIKNNYRYGLYGSMILLNHVINYDINFQDITNGYLNIDENRKNTTYTLKLHRNLDNSRYNINFIHSKRDYTRTDTRDANETTNWKDDFSEFNANYNWSPNKKFRLRSYFKYSDNAYINLKTTTASTDMYWAVSEKYNTSFGAIAENLENTSDNTKYISLYASGIYNITPHLSTNQYITLFDTASDSLSQQTASLKLGLSYRNTVGETMTYYANSDIEGKIDQGDNKIGDDYFLNKNSTAYNASLGLAKKFQNINSRLNINSRYYLYSSDIGERLLRYSLSSVFFTQIGGSFRNTLSTSYSNVKNDYDYERQVSATNPSSSTEILVITESINYTQTLGIKGNLNANLGLRYYVADIGNRSNPFANINLNYFLLNNLIFKSSLLITNDLYSGYTNYTATAGIEYQIGQIRLLAGLRYVSNKQDDTDIFNNLTKEEEEPSSYIKEDTTTYEKRNIYFQIKRVF